MRHLLALSLWILHVQAATAQDAIPPTAPNCQLASPPPGAGDQIFVHTGIFRVFPRKSEMGAGYSGCQVIWLSEQGEYRKYLMTYFDRGRLRFARHYEPYDAFCTYENDKLVTGTQWCSDPAGKPTFPVASVPGGCFDAFEKTGILPKHCESD